MAEVLQQDALKPCPWGCTPQRTTKSVQGPEPNFPDRVRPVIYCQHAHMEGERRLVLGDEDWAALAAAWNTRPTDALKAENQRLRQQIAYLTGEPCPPCTINDYRVPEVDEIIADLRASGKDRAAEVIGLMRLATRTLQDDAIAELARAALKEPSHEC